MLKNISAGIRTLEEKSACIKERNAAIKAGQYTVVDGGYWSFGDIILVGEQHKAAAVQMKQCAESAISIEEIVEFEKEIEEIFNVQVWSSTDFNLSAVIGNC